MDRALTVVIAVIAAAATIAPAFATDDAGTVRADAKVLLARTARAHSVDPAGISVANVIVDGDKASAVWQAGSLGGTLALERRGNRWFASCPQGNAMLTAHWPLLPEGGVVAPDTSATSCYVMTLRYAANDAPSDGTIAFLYGRAPTDAEFLPYPTTYPFTSDAVYYFDVTIGGSKPVAFAPGTRLAVWFPFVLDDKLWYDVSLAFTSAPIDGISARPFDNTLEFTLPGFTAVPGRTMMGEIDGAPR